MSRRVRTRSSLLACLAVVLAGCTSPAADRGGPVTGDAVTPAEVVTTVRYGDLPDQFVDVHVPDGEPTGPTVVLVHGGFWRDQYRSDLMVGLARDLVARGMVAVNVEYRRVGGAGGWPATLADVAAAVDALADRGLMGDLADVVDPDRVVTVGHSAGGHLAVWAASRHNVPDALRDDVGGAPLVRPCAAVSQAGVVVLDDAVDLGAGAVAELLGGPRTEVPDRWAAADPASLLPTGVPVLLVHGEGDDLVPPAQSDRYAELARAAGDRPTVVPVAGGHFEVIDPSDPAWTTVADQLPSLCGSSG